ncbi:MAG: hypothetical protein JXA67_11710 [Micromonosporaceae bacterium]|nr:hypothetical protein [Micromonosporaceae bacterium]
MGDRRARNRGRGPIASHEQPAADPGLDQPVLGQRPCHGTGGDGTPLTVRVQVRIVTGRRAVAVRAAQGHALRALITALTSGDTEPNDDDHQLGEDEA